METVKIQDLNSPLKTLGNEPSDYVEVQPNQINCDRHGSL
jgi:hypothetical protein